jgi:hypothetical protein
MDVSCRNKFPDVALATLLNNGLSWLISLQRFAKRLAVATLGKLKTNKTK